MGPAFLTYGLKRYAATKTVVDLSLTRRPPRSEMSHRDMQALPAAASQGSSSRPASWMRQRLRPELDAFFRDVVSMIEGRGTQRPITARLACGQMPDRLRASFGGGNLTVLSTFVGSPFDEGGDPGRRWLLIEDFNEKVERIDRFLAQLTLRGYWSNCEGILLGDFHKGYEDLTQAVLALLRFHVPRVNPVPVLVTDQVGHIWPMSPLPLHLDLSVERTQNDTYSIHWPAEALKTVPSTHPSRE